MTVYVITRGEYSDYHICAVALDKKKAEILAKMYSSRYDEAMVEEWETDTTTDVQAFNGRRPHVVYFRHDGSVDAYRHDYGYDSFHECVQENKDNTFGYAPWSLNVYVYAPDEATAIKIAADKRAQYLAEKEGIV